MQIEECSYKRNDDGTYKVVLSYIKDNSKKLIYEYPKVKINWRTTSVFNMPMPLDMIAVPSGNNDTLINFYVEE